MTSRTSYGLRSVGVDDAVDLGRVVRGASGRDEVRRGSASTACSVETIVRAQLQRVLVVFGEVVGDAGEARVDVGAAQLLGRHLLAGRRLHQRRAAEEDRARALDDDRLVRHRRHVGAARRARAHDDGDLRDPLGRHPRLVEEDAAEVLAVGEDLGLQRQEGAARIDEVDAGQAVLERDLLRAEVLLHRDGEVGAALDRRVVGDDHHLAAGDAADAGDEPGAGRLVVVHARRRRAARARERASRGRAAARCARATGSLPCSRWRSRDRGPPPCRASARRSRSSATSRAIRSRFAPEIVRNRRWIRVSRTSMMQSGWTRQSLFQIAAP